MCVRLFIFFFLPSVFSWLVHNGQLPGAEMPPAHRHPREVGGNEGSDWSVGGRVIFDQLLAARSVS